MSARIGRLESLPHDKPTHQREGVSPRQGVFISRGGEVNATLALSGADNTTGEWSLNFNSSHVAVTWIDGSPEGKSVVSGQGIATTLTPAGQDIDLKIEGLTPSASLRDLTITGAFKNDATGGIYKDSALTTVFAVDLVAQGLPEETEPMPHELNPGAYIGLNDDDDDNDDVLDLSGLQPVPVSGENDLVAATLHLRPATLDLGTLSLQASAGADKVAFYLSPDKASPMPVSWTLGPTTGTAADVPGTVYVEGVATSLTLGDVTLALQHQIPQGASASGVAALDEVEATVFKVDLDLDSDNNNGFDDPDRSNAEEAIEDDQDKPGKLIVVNDDDGDADDIPDFADGMGLFADQPDSATPPKEEEGERFVPVVLQLSDALDLDKVHLRLVYDASDPRYDPEDPNNFPSSSANLAKTKTTWSARQ